MSSNTKEYVQGLRDTCRQLQAQTGGAGMLNDRELYTKLGELARYIEETMRKLSDLEHPLSVSTGQLPKASDALTDLTRMIEDGTHRVMELTETLQVSHRQFRAGLETIEVGLAETGHEHIGTMAQVAGLMNLVVENQKTTMDIMTALSFQDLTGQRIKKVVGILDDVQSRLLELVVVFGSKCAPKEGGADRAEVLLKELAQTKKIAIKQDVVDDLLKEFGF